jgi:cysteine desulfurase
MKRIYLDQNATTQVAPEVFDAMAPFLRDSFGNASSMHSFGREAKVALEEAREVCANAIGAEPSEIIFCASGTESDNLALKGAARALKSKRRRIITTPIEHPAVSQSATELAEEGFELQIVPVDSDGFVSVSDLEKLVDDNTAVVSIMFANNEIGVIQDIKALAQVAHKHGALFHTDAVQAFGKIPVNVEEPGVDLLSLSAHKFYGPKGVGLLYCRSGVKLDSVIHGGSHEQGRRAGTENIPYIVGIARAMELAVANVESDYQRLFKLSTRFISKLRDVIPDMTLNGPELREDKVVRTPSTVNISFTGAEGEAVILSLDLKGIAVSSGSACSSGAVDPSPVLLAVGQEPELAKSSIRFSMGKSTTAEDIDYVCAELPPIIERLRAMSPQYAGRV